MPETKDSRLERGELQNELRDNPPPMLFGPPSYVDGYYNLELHERGVRLESLRAHTTETALWYQGLQLLTQPMFGTWEFPADEVSRKVRILQSEILGLEVSAAKAAIDLILDGHYSIAMAAVRHMLEAFAQMFYVQCYPESVELWYSQGAKTPGCGQMIDQIKKHIRTVTDNTDKLSAIDKLYSSWQLMSNGSHPTGGGMTQVQPSEDDPRHMVGPVYRPRLAYVAFDNGLFALNYLLDCILILDRDDQRWRKEFAIWSENVANWRNGLVNIESIHDQISEERRQQFEEQSLKRDAVVELDHPPVGARPPTIRTDFPSLP